MTRAHRKPQDPWLAPLPTGARELPEGDSLGAVPGFQTIAIEGGIKSAHMAAHGAKKTAGQAPPKVLDLALLCADRPVPAAAVFTQSSIVAAPVTLCRRHLKQSKLTRAVLVNSGNANCATGDAGMAAAETTARQAARRLGCRPREILICSTGVIGRQLPPHFPAAVEKLFDAHAAAASQGEFRRAIMTTDTVPKSVAVQVKHGGGRFTVAGACKGSGMIAPNMATMLGFMATDLAVATPVLRKVLSAAVRQTFNRVSVDTDTSTNDTLILLASGAARLPAVQRPSGSLFTVFAQAVTAVCSRLAFKLAEDGEGATHTVVVRVTGAKSEVQAEAVARSVGDSPLVKTAIAGNDPNWGRILAAIGKARAGVRDRDLTVKFGGIAVFVKGQPKTDAGVLAKLKTAMAAKLVPIELEIGAGRAQASFFTCDLTHGYISINADYTT
ncbi:MAG: bifunctional glutamate N-acetyltransferase/amino-acid acetyltransferase ArgJ [Planctomycetota bacterium]